MCVAAKTLCLSDAVAGGAVASAAARDNLEMFCEMWSAIVEDVVVMNARDDFAASLCG